jgi:hypothetical protein
MGEPGAQRRARRIGVERMQAAGGEGEGSRAGYADQRERSASRRSRERN